MAPIELLRVFDVPGTSVFGPPDSELEGSRAIAHRSSSNLSTSVHLASRVVPSLWALPTLYASRTANNVDDALFMSGPIRFLGLLRDRR